jgi:hypothetical protein
VLRRAALPLRTLPFGPFCCHPSHSVPTLPTLPTRLQGITLKLRYNRAGHLFEFPVMLSSNPLDWPTLGAAAALPPLLYLAGSRLVVGPLRRGIEARRCVGGGVGGSGEAWAAGVEREGGPFACAEPKVVLAASAERRHTVGPQSCC